MNELRKGYISVIIPVYKVEPFLARCVDSVLAQSHKELDIILVDDGSPDACPEICDTYAEREERIRVIHKPNGGLASARNAGMELARGEYLFFLDSDDWLEPDGLAGLYQVAEEKDVDFVRYRAIRSGWPGLPEHAPCMVEPVRELEEGLYDRGRILSEIYPRLLATSELSMGAVVGAWGSLYRTDFLNDNHLRFYEEVKFSEDLIFSANVVKAAKQFYFVDTAGVYHYFYNANSISKSFRKNRWESCKGLIRYCEQDFKDNPDYDFGQELQYLRWFCIMLALNERRYLKSWKERYRYCKMILDDETVKKTTLNLSLFHISWKQKVLMLLAKRRLASLLAIF